MSSTLSRVEGAENALVRTGWRATFDDYLELTKPRIIVLTNYDLPEYKNAAIALGATHFLDKARDYGRLPEVLHEICEAHLSKH